MWVNRFRMLGGGAWRDVRDSWRGLRASPGFTTAALVLFAFSIGLNTAVFTIINAILLRPLPVKAPQELAFIWRVGPTGTANGLGPYEDVRRFVANTDLFAGGAGVEVDTAKLRIGLNVEALTGERVSPNYFDVLGVAPSLGRTLVAADALPDAERVVVLSDALWRRRFNADPSVIGTRITLGTRLFGSEAAPRYTVVGVMGNEFTGVVNRTAPTEYWVEFSQREDDTFGILVTRTPQIGMAVTRLKPGVALEEVRAFAAAALPSSDVVVRPDASDGGSGPIVRPVPDARLPFGSPSRLGAGMTLVAAVVLVIAAINSSGLALARGVTRRREAAIRLALGATKWHIARRMLTESVLLALAGGLAGLVLSRVFVRAVLASVASSVDEGVRFAALGMPVDGRVFSFTTLLALAVGLAVGFGVLRRGVTISTSELADGEPLATPAVGRFRRRHWILIPQLALSTALLLLAFGAARALLNVALVESGYEPHRAAYLEFESLYQPLQQMSDEQKAGHRARLEAFPRRLLALAQAMPQFEAVAFARTLPTEVRQPVWLLARDTSSGQRTTFSAELAQVTAGYFRALGIPVLRGRAFADDVAGGRPVAVVDERLAARLWPGESALGKSVATAAGPAEPAWHEIVGVVGAIRGPLSEGETQAVVYFPWPNRAVEQLVLVGRGRQSSAELLTSLRALSTKVDSNVGVLEARMLQERIDEQRHPRRLAAHVLSVCGIGGLVLAVSGLYGTLSYSIALRSRELGIRSALGASRRTIVRLIVAEGALIAGAGSAAGIFLGLLARRMASHYLLPVPPVDTATICVTSVAFGLVTLLACSIPAVRAARLDPATVLRT